MKKIIITVLLASLILITGCTNKSPQEVMFSFYKENFLFRNFDVAQDLTVDISKEELKEESKKIDNNFRKIYIKKFSIAYREISNTSTRKKFQLFSIDFSHLINIDLIKTNGTWKVNSFDTKIFNDPEKMVKFLNSHKWKEQELTNKKP